jgi:hypothetical protein
MTPVFTPRNGADLAVVMCLLDAYGIPYFVHNLYFGGLYPIPVFELYNLRRIFVPSEAAAAARQLLDDLVPGMETASYDMSGSDKLRVLVEFFLLGGWFVPGNKWPRRSRG